MSLCESPLNTTPAPYTGDGSIAYMFVRPHEAARTRRHGYRAPSLINASADILRRLIQGAWRRTCDQNLKRIRSRYGPKPFQRPVRASRQVLHALQECDRRVTDLRARIPFGG